ncbi:InaD-like protein [Merluccius polli]|uniref:InaD-like protein n=1 Tax=Merluccius polli TaxID=89951 RepID=A0AA47P8Y7_MERPO|nr:InaD-like protein [Merluccius polli]
MLSLTRVAAISSGDRDAAITRRSPPVEIQVSAVERQQVLAALERLQTKLAQKEEWGHSQTLGALRDTLQRPLLAHILTLQHSVRQLRDQLNNLPGNSCNDFSFSRKGQLIVSLAPPTTSSLQAPPPQSSALAPPPQASVLANGSASLSPEQLQRWIQSISKDQVVEVVSLSRPAAGGLGFSVAALRSEGTQRGFFIKHIQPGGVAQSGGVRQRLRRGVDRPPLPSMILCNARSLKSKADELRFNTRTWLQEGVPDSLIALDGSFLVRSDRNANSGNSKGEGTFVFVNQKDGRLKEMDRILVMNGSPLDPELSQQGALILLQQPAPTLELLVARDRPPHASPLQPTPTWEHVEEVELVNDGSGLGFGIVGGRTSGVVVRTLVPNSVADKDGRLRTGDHILRIGATPTGGLTSDQVVRVLQGCGSRVTMLIAREPRSQSPAPTQPPPPPSSAPIYTPPPPPACPPNLPLKEGQSLGISIIGYNALTSQDAVGVFVKHVVPGSAADQSGNIRVHDRLIALDGVSLQGFTNQEVLEVMKEARQEVQLSLVRKTRTLERSLDRVERESSRVSLKRSLEVRTRSSDLNRTSVTTDVKSKWEQALGPQYHVMIVELDPVIEDDAELQKYSKEVIAKEVTEAGMFSVQIDTTQDITSQEQCSIVLRYVKDTVQERLLAVVKCEATTGQYFVQMLADVMEKYKLEISNCISNATDGASNMQGQYRGFATLLSSKAPNQVHVWCYAHVLNLVLTDTTAVSISSGTLFSLLNDIAVFFRESYQRMNVWEQGSQDSRHRRLSMIGETRWWAKDVALKKIFGSFAKPEQCVYVDVLRTLEVIEAKENLKSSVRVKARGYLESLMRYETVLTAQLFLRIFEVTTPLSKYLQTHGLDILYNLLTDAYHILGLGYKFLLTLPVTQVACERSFSILKYIKNRLRSNSSQEHLEAFMLMATEKDILMSLDSDCLLPIHTMRLGVELDSFDGHHYISSLAPGGALDTHGLIHPEDELLEVNGVQLYGKSRREAVAFLREVPPPFTLVCCRHLDLENHLEPEQWRTTPNVEEIELKLSSLLSSKMDVKDKQQDPPAPPHSSRLEKDEEAEEEGELALWSPDIQMLELQKESDQGLGFSILDYQDPVDPGSCVMVIRSLVASGAAERQGCLLPGDQLVSVNQTLLEQLSLAQAVEVLKSAPPGPVRLGVRKPLVVRCVGL